MRSPGDFDLLGAGKVIEQIRELFKDFSYKNRLEREHAEEDLRHKKHANRLNELKGHQGILSNQIELMKELGYDQEQIEIGLKALSDPLSQIDELSRRNEVKTKADQLNPNEP